MADEKKKPKIDIKARLGKTAMGLPAGAATPLPTPSSGASTPPASGPGAGRPSVPTPAPSAALNLAPPPGLSPGIPLPPFGQPARRAPEPRPSAAQQTIKIEMGEEVEAERKKASKKMAIYAVLAAVVGAGIGFLVGGASKTSEVAKRAQKGAGELEVAVKGANEKLEELRDKINEGLETIKKKQYPDSLTASLNAVVIPFDASYLDNKGVGNFNGPLQKRVFSFTQAITDLNQTKESLTNMLGVAKAPVTKAWKEQENPVVNFSVTFRGDNKGMVAELIPNKDPFEVGKDWPDSYTILRQERSQAGVKTVEKKANRWKKGDLTATDPVVIPVDPSSVAAFTSEQLVYKLSSALLNIHDLIEGKKDDPRNETSGLLKDGEQLVVELRKLR
jgi:cytochrome oxidase Cu insertion factor (SCO1/SenC/PrrC family)